jgi:transcriptional regulator with XRE-family HTH domain
MSNKLREYMEQLGISQLELSRITKIAPTDLNQIVNGKRYCYPGWRKRISEALGVPENKLFDTMSERGA